MSLRQCAAAAAFSSLCAASSALLSLPKGLVWECLSLRGSEALVPSSWELWAGPGTAHRDMPHMGRGVLARVSSKPRLSEPGGWTGLGWWLLPPPGTSINISAYHPCWLSLDSREGESDRGERHQDSGTDRGAVVQQGGKHRDDNRFHFCWTERWKTAFDWIWVLRFRDMMYPDPSRQNPQTLVFCTQNQSLI